MQWIKQHFCLDTEYMLKCKQQSHMLRRHAELIILCSCLVSHSLRLGNRRTQKRLRQRDIDVNPIEQISLQVLNKHLPQNHEQCHLSSLTPLPPAPPPLLFTLSWVSCYRGTWWEQWAVAFPSHSPKRLLQSKEPTSRLSTTAPPPTSPSPAPNDVGKAGEGVPLSVLRQTSRA